MMLRRHPELQAYTPSDRYGISTSGRAENGGKVSAARKAAAPAAGTYGKLSRLAQKTANNAKAAKPPTGNKETKAANGKSTRTNGSKSRIPSFSSRTGPSKLICKSMLGQVEQTEASSSDTLSMYKVCNTDDNVFVSGAQCEAPKVEDASLDGPSENQIKQSDCSDVASSSAYVSSSSTSSAGSESCDCSRRDEAQSNKRQSPIQRTKEQFDAMAKKEEQDRLYRLQMVESILSRLNIRAG
jgi:hypothetical protein